MRSKDRLDELRRACDAVYNETTLPLDDGPAADSPQALPKELDELLREVEQTRGWIHDIERNTQLVRRLHADPTYHTSRQLQEQLEAAVTRGHAAGLKACGALRQLEAAAARIGGAGGAGGTLARLARLQAAVTRRLAADALAAHHAALAALHDDKLLLLRKQIELTNLSITDDECQSLLETNNIALFVDNVRAETAEARRALRDVESRHEELLRVEAALREVRDLFAQLAHLVALQQDQVDSVEYYALQAGDCVESGGQELLNGSVSRAKAKKKQLSLIICLASGFLVVVLVLVFT